MTAAELIAEARDHHLSFTPVVHLEKVLRGELQRAELRFYQKLAELAEGSVAVETVIDAADIATALSGTPITIPSFIKLLSVLAVKNNSLYAVAVSQDERSDGFGYFRARLIGRNLYLAQPAALQAEMPASMATDLAEVSAFADADALRLTYVPYPAALTTPTQVLTAPDESRGYFIGCLVKFMAMRSPNAGDMRKDLVQMGKEQESAVIDSFVTRAGNETGWHVSEVGN